MVHSARRIALLLASFDVALVKERNQAESTELRDFPLHTLSFARSVPLAHRSAGRVFEWAITQPIVRDDPCHHINQLCIRAVTSARTFAAATCCARPRAPPQVTRHFDGARANGSLIAPLRGSLLLLASHRMMLTRERKNLNWIAGRIEFFSFCLVSPHRTGPHVGPKLSAAQSVDCFDRLMFFYMKHLVESKSLFPRGMFLHLAHWQKQVQIWERHFS